MMEVTPHLKSVLKNYQYSATKSLQGPGLSLVKTAKNEPPSPEIKEEIEFTPASFPVQQVPILAAPDTSCSELTDTLLEGKSISCFVVGGEKRLCLPQILNSVLRDFSLPQINQECDQLQIYCSRSTPEQLNVLKNENVLPSGAPSCGLITKTDAERLCSALLFGQVTTGLRPRKGALSFTIYHECFGESRGLCFPELYTSKDSRCIVCEDCDGGFAPQQFVCHVHRNLENRTVHWGFDSSRNWRYYLHVPKDIGEHKQYEKYLDDMKEMYDEKVPFPQPVVEASAKRKIPVSDVIKDHDLPLKKQKLDAYINNLNRIPFNMAPVPASLQHMYATLEPMYIQQCLQEFNNVNRHLSAFKPVVQSIKESKIRHANAVGISTRYATDPPVLQNPERVVLMSESERFERSYQPNVALAPPTPKKHRYGRLHELSTNHSSSPCTSTTPTVKSEPLSPVKVETSSIITNGHHPKTEPVEPPMRSPEKPVVDSTVSVVQSTANHQKYNPEIELSTDTEDSASETSEKNSDHAKLEEALKSVEYSVREKILEHYKKLSKELDRVVLQNREKDDLIKSLQLKNDELTTELNNLKSTNSINTDSNDTNHSETEIIASVNTSDSGSKPVALAANPSPTETSQNGIKEEESGVPTASNNSNNAPNVVEATSEQNTVIKSSGPEQPDRQSEAIKNTAPE